MHLMDLAAEVKIGVQEAGLVGYRFNTIGVSDGISMGTDGMSYSLQSRDLIADSIETVMGAQWYDANISLPGEEALQCLRRTSPKRGTGACTYECSIITVVLQLLAWRKARSSFCTCITSGVPILAAPLWEELAAGCG